MQHNRMDCSASRKEHCSASKLNVYGRCVADCWRNWATMFRCDCIGTSYVDEQRRIAAEFCSENKSRLPR